MTSTPARLLLSCLLAWLAFAAKADIAGNYTLTADQTFTSVTNDTFVIGGNNNTFNLQGFTATFTGSGNFELNSSIIGTGNVWIEMSDPNGVVSVIYDTGDGNSYSGLTTVRAGTLLLGTPSGGNDGIAGDLYIGGGAYPATVTRHEHHNVELIADTATVTIASNGTLVLNRMDTGNSSVHSSLETFRKLVLDGGTLLNASDNTRRTTLNILESIELLSDSTIDMGVAMTINVGDVDTTAWNSSAILTIKNWSTAEPIYVGQITDQQLSQIMFETTNGLVAAAQIADGQIVPSTLVPEASALALIPLLIGAVFWPSLKQRFARRA